ncbi:MAG TPA: alpha/beta hydrolase [Patescibacteria group bacterium]|nr:alpha/beta hydrolase [Patescibacteria group bacterium]
MSSSLSLLPIVFIPGASSDEASWEAQRSHFGGTTVNLTGFDNIGSMGDYVLQQAPEAFILCGTSMGGYVAFDVLKKAGNRVKAAILCNTSARADTPERKRQRQMEINAGEDAYRAARQDDSHYHAFISRKSAGDKQLIARLRAISERVGYSTFKRHQQACMDRAESLSYLSEIKMPVLVIGGSEDTLIPNELQKEIADGIAGSQLSFIPDTGHITNMEAPGALNDEIEEFLKAA